MNSNNNTITNSRIYGNRFAGIEFFGITADNTFYNNLFNNSRNIYFDIVANNTWNTTVQAGTRVYSTGVNIAGNYWINYSDNSGFSDTCPDADTDGFCDTAYNVTNNKECVWGYNCSGNVDLKPLSGSFTPTPPTFHSNTTLPMMPYYNSNSSGTPIIIVVNVTQGSYAIASVNFTITASNGT
jgi:hypothetical protein